MKPTSIRRVLGSAKADPWTKAHGGFAIYRLSTGEIAYFPIGQPPHIGGETDRRASLIGKWSWNRQRWSRVQ